MKILAVDDERRALRLLVAEIEGAVERAEVFPFEFPDKALEFDARNPCDIAFLDVELPQMNGIELARRLKAQNPGISIIFATAYREYSFEAFGVRANGYLLKPVTADAIKTEIEMLAGRNLKVSKGVFISCFGKFEVYADGEPVHFLREKSREMLAVLVDRRCAMKRRELADVLFEEGTYEQQVRNYMNQIQRALKKSLGEVGIGNMLIAEWNSYRLDESTFSCDYYDYCAGMPWALSAFDGRYMEQYSWAEETLGMLYMKSFGNME